MENNEYSDYRKETEPIRPTIVNEPKPEKRRIRSFASFV